MTERAKKLLLLYYEQSRKIRRVSGLPPLTFKGRGKNLKNYRIYGNTVNGESIGDLITEGEHAGEYRVPVTVEGKNLCNNIWEQKIINVNTGNASPTENTVCCDFIPVKPNVTYSCSRTIANNYNNLRCYGANKNYLGSGEVLVNKVNPLPQWASFGTFMITDARVSYIRFNDFSNSLDTKYMLVEGVYTAETMPPYEPYHAPITTPVYLPEPIKMVGDEVEYVDYKEQKQHRVRKNLLQNIAASKTISGVTFTVNADGSVTCNGTNTANSATTFNISTYLLIGTYIINGCPKNGSSGTYSVDLRDPSNWYVLGERDTGLGFTFTNNTVRTVYYVIRISAGYTCNNLTFYPMIRKADIADNTYEPYITNTELDVTLPALPTIKGTNVLSVGTEAQPSDIYLKGKIKKPKIYYKIYYYSQDGQTLLYTESVLKGSNGMYSGIPTKMADPQYTYTFAGWSSSTGQTTATPEVRNNIQNDKNVYAAFSQTLNTYTVYFYNESDTPIETVQNVPSGGTATYTGATPTKSGYVFTGWSPSPTNIQADTACYAQFKEDEMYESITDTWSQIIANVSNGTYSTKYHIGDTKKIDLGTEGEVIMTIVGIDTDDLADNSGKAPITWISKQLLKTNHRMNPAKQSGTSGTGALGGWEACEMRSYLINTIKPLLPSEVRNALKTVKKYSRMYSASAIVNNNIVSSDDIWIPSAYEVNSSDFETSGVTYSSTFPDNASRIKHKVGGSAARWWLRSASGPSSFMLVYNEGGTMANAADNSIGVAVGFVI